MPITYSAKIQHVDEDVEGVVLLSINGIDLLCFGYGSLPYGAKEGDIFQVQLTPMSFNDYLVKELKENTPPSIARVGDTLVYIVSGILRKNSLEACGIVFEDDVLLEEFGFLEGKIISWEIDRIDVEFLDQ